jgi:hypothetical protein
MNSRPLAAFVALVALIGAACGSAANPAPTGAPPAASAAVSTAAVGSATPTATAQPVGMSHGRQVHTATRLADGRVLLAGGYFREVPLASADVYDPRTGTFTATSPMATARGFDSAALLTDGRVLFAGGNPQNWQFEGPFIGSAELFDPGTNTFGPTGSLVTARNLQTATPLRDGRVLIIGGNDAFPHALTSAELYDPRTGTFTPTGSMKAPRGFHVATLLADGRVLVTGGSPFGMNSDSGHFLTSAEIYEPKTGTFSTTGSMTTERASQAATLLADGRVLITGGAASTVGSGSFALISAELYDPKTGRFTSTGSMTTGRTFQEATLLSDGRVLITGGDPDGWSYEGHYLSTAELYDPKAGTFRRTGSMTDKRSYHTATLLLDGRVLIAGGFNGYKELASGELYDPMSGTFSPID